MCYNIVGGGTMKKSLLESYLGKRVKVTMIDFFKGKGPNDIYVGVLQKNKKRNFRCERYNCKGTNLWFCCSHVKKVEIV